MSKQSDIWSGDFGDDYTDRNKINYRNNLKVFIDVITALKNKYHDYSVLEIGCNKGHNLTALKFLGFKQVNIIGVDINDYALRLAREDGHNVINENILNLSFDNNTFDLVFTMGVLIHISPDDIDKAVKEMCRVSKKYILAMEYPADTEEVVHYHGRDDLLWKRNFARVLTEANPNIRIIGHWNWGGKYSSFYDRLDGWLFEKEK